MARDANGGWQLKIFGDPRSGAHEHSEEIFSADGTCLEEVPKAPEGTEAARRNDVQKARVMSWRGMSFTKA